MKAFQNFTYNINKLETFYKSTIYAYEQTETLLTYQKKNHIQFDVASDTGLLIKQPHTFKAKRKSNIELRKNLCEIVFVRVVSVLEVFLIDLVRDAFLESKEPFKKQDVIPQFSQAELLSFQSTSEIYAKIINKETRRLSSGGFLDIIKFYKKYFDVDLSNIAPGKSKMEEYHDRRHLLVHRVGKTDIQYRDKYNTSKQSISIEEDYLIDCIKDFKYFCDLVNNQVIFQLQQFNQISKKGKKIQRKVLLQIEFLTSSDRDYIQPAYEFWANDEYSRFEDILDSMKSHGENKTEFVLSGSFRQIRSYIRYLKRIERQKEIKLFERDINVDEIKVKSPGEEREYSQRILDEDILIKIQNLLPIQPWEKGIHKIIAAELNVPNKIVTLAITQLIVRGVFKNQINGVVIEEQNNSIQDVGPKAQRTT